MKQATSRPPPLGSSAGSANIDQLDSGAEGFPIVRQWYVVHRTRKRLSTAAQIFRSMLLARDPAAQKA